jgi:hypothetical protein
MSEPERTTAKRDDTQDWEALLKKRRGATDETSHIIDAIKGSPVNAREVLERMVGEPDLRSDIAYADSVAMLQIVGKERDGGGWSVADERSGAIGVASVGVAWRFQATHDWEPDYDPTKPNVELRALPPTGRNLEAHGFSIFGVDHEGFKVSRYVDWAGLYVQLGIGLNWRLPVDETPVLRRPAAEPDPGASDTTGDNASPPA